MKKCDLRIKGEENGSLHKKMAASAVRTLHRGLSFPLVECYDIQKNGMASNNSPCVNKTINLHKSSTCWRSDNAGIVTLSNTLWNDRNLITEQDDPLSGLSFLIDWKTPYHPQRASCLGPIAPWWSFCVGFLHSVIGMRHSELAGQAHTYTQTWPWTSH